MVEKLQKIKKSLLSVEILKYPYCGKTVESKEFLSEKICSATGRVRRKMVKKVKPIIVSAIIIFHISYEPASAISLTPFRLTPVMMQRSNHLKADLLEGLTVFSDLDPKFDKIVSTKVQIEKLDEIIMNSNNNFIDEKQLIEAIKTGEFDKIEYKKFDV